MERKKNQKQSSEWKLEQEIEKRIEQLEQDDYEFPTRFQKKDYIVVTVVVCVCLFLLVIGVWL